LLSFASCSVIPVLAASNSKTFIPAEPNVPINALLAPVKFSPISLPNLLAVVARAIYTFFSKKCQIKI